MKRNTRPTLVLINCRGGCGKQMTSVNQSIYGLNDLHSQYAGYCSDCLPITKDQLLDKMGRGIVGLPT